MRGALAACALAAFLVAGDTTAGGRPVGYAVLSKGGTSELVRVDPATLRISGPRLPLAHHQLPWSRSPEGSRVAVASASARSIRVVDLPGWFVVRDVRLRGNPAALAWPRHDRLLVVLWGRVLRAVALDPETGRTTAAATLGRGSLLDAARTPAGLALLLAPLTGIGTARLVTVDAHARARSVRLDGIDAGWKTVQRASGTAPGLSRYSTPGLAIDHRGRRALVVSGSALAVVDLTTRAVRIAPMRIRRLADGGFSEGTYRRAAWLRGNVVAVTGRNDRVTGTGAGRRQATAAAGLLFVDVRTLAVRRVDARASTMTRAGDLLLATGSGGITGYDLAGRRRFRVLPRRWLPELPVVGRYAYVGGADTYKRHRVRVLDLRSGRTRAVWVRGALTPLSDATPRICWC